MDIKEMRREGVDWINLAQDRENERVLFKLVMNVLFNIMRGICRLAEDVLLSQEGLCFVAVVS